MPDWIPHLVSTVFVGGAAYGAITQHLKGLTERVARAEKEADSAHARIDSILMKG